MNCEHGRLEGAFCPHCNDSTPCEKCGCIMVEKLVCVSCGPGVYDKILAESNRKELFELRRLLYDLLAVIHGDGGHYLDQHGLEKACADAHTVVLHERAPAPASKPCEPELEAYLRDLRQSLITTGLTSAQADADIDRMRKKYATCTSPDCRRVECVAARIKRVIAEDPILVREHDDFTQHLIRKPTPGDKK